ncbi:PilZ domain-containing protein [Paenibacillus aurantiacus]|uniref:PilZ domain-containing protein n=1 Tax=Paenibacillus aurantiacus TaxID=1936118 RepID=A0ABV5L0L4_9BACL
MTRASRVEQSGVYGKEMTTYPLQALLDSRTVVEKDGYVSTGLVTHVEGEMLEIEMSEFKSFHLGDPVHLTLYSPVGIQRLQSTVIAVAEGSLAVLLPPKSLAGLEEKREATRVEVRLDGKIQPSTQATGAEGADDIDEEPAAVFKTRNVSLSGIGFEAVHNVTLGIGEILPAVVSLGHELSCQLEIVRRELEGEYCFYGARFVGLNELQTRMLRAFLIREQVSNYYRIKEKRKSLERM